MGLAIETFNNLRGGNNFYKAISHPLTAERASVLVQNLSEHSAPAIYDPAGFFQGFDDFHARGLINFKNAFVQNIEQVGKKVRGLSAKPVVQLPYCDVDALLISAFDAQSFKDDIAHLLPSEISLYSFDDIRLDKLWLTNQRDYLSKENFATNFAFFREKEGLSTRVSTANYWSNYGATNINLHFILFNEVGDIIANWSEEILEDARPILIDSSEVRRRFNLPEFTGQLFIHASGVKGHDVIKYALDIQSEDLTSLTSTHDANAWPSDLFAGLPAPKEGEKVTLWLQNSHPYTIPEGEVGLNIMGSAEVFWLDKKIPPFGSYPLIVNTFLPNARWPEQIEIQAGKHFVRPRYEITGKISGRRMAHVNVERTDIKSDPGIAEATKLIGKGYILPAPILPPGTWLSTVLPTPMATTQMVLPIAALVYDPEGKELARHRFGCLSRDHTETLETTPFLDDKPFGHVELVYDFNSGHEADGWLHALFRFENKLTAHAAETSFGSHIFNTVLTYKDEPQSYSKYPPGLSTRLYLRLGSGGLETFCHLIYPASARWHKVSDTFLYLIGADGKKAAESRIEIPCGGSRLLRISDIFDDEVLARAGSGSYIIIRDTTCRLFGYHALVTETGPFSLDHMFGF
jgi:hypothetical protein